jgi:hypothetical protein
MEVSGQLYAPASLPPGKEPPLPIGLDMVSKRKNPSPRRKSNPNHPIVQLVASLYTDWNIPATYVNNDIFKIIFRNWFFKGSSIS